MQHNNKLTKVKKNNSKFSKSNNPNTLRIIDSNQNLKLKKLEKVLKKIV